MSDPADDLRTRRVAGIGAATSALRETPTELHGLDRVSVAFDRWWDRVRDRGLDLRGITVELDHFSPDFVHYEGTPWRYLARAVPRRSVSRDDVFLDVGCGKGRVVLQAATRYPLRRVIGVDLVDKLTATARQNLDRAPHRRRAESVEIVTADATRWEVPGDVTIVYLFHPVAGAAFEAVLARVIESHDRRPRPVRLIYTCPLLHERVLATGRFALSRQVAFRPRAHVARQVNVYALTT